MLVNMHGILADARKHGYAVGAINTPSVDLVRAVIGAAEDVGTPVIIAHAQVHDAVVPMETIAPFMIQLASSARVPVAVHIDHGRDARFLARGVRAGFTSAMYDLSTRPFDENLARVAKFVELAHSLDITVEAELGVMTSAHHDSHDDSHQLPRGSANLSDALTDPDLAAAFAARSRVDALAVCFGTAHGMYDQEPRLDFERLTAIRAAVPAETSLVMHGSSGVDLAQIIRAIRAGVSKVNYYSYLSAEAARFVGQTVAASNGPCFYPEVVEAMIVHIRSETTTLLDAFANSAVPV